MSCPTERSAAFAHLDRRHPGYSCHRGMRDSCRCASKRFAEIVDEDVEAHDLSSRRERATSARRLHLGASRSGAVTCRRNPTRRRGTSTSRFAGIGTTRRGGAAEDGSLGAAPTSPPARAGELGDEVIISDSTSRLASPGGLHYSDGAGCGPRTSPSRSTSTRSIPSSTRSPRTAGPSCSSARSGEASAGAWRCWSR
jgi:hypothetical protein